MPYQHVSEMCILFPQELFNVMLVVSKDFQAVLQAVERLPDLHPAYELKQVARYAISTYISYRIYHSH